MLIETLRMYLHSSNDKHTEHEGLAWIYIIQMRAGRTGSTTVWAIKGVEFLIMINHTSLCS